MPSPKVDCPVCGGPMSKGAKSCLPCSKPYERTQDHRERMSDATRGKPKPHLQGRKRPNHAQLMRDWWTPERREAKRQEMLKRNPNARYHGLSAEGARTLRESVGRCEQCGHDGSESRLDVHHRNGNKRDQRLANLEVLCHHCHMRRHSEQGDLKRNTHPS